MDDKTLLELAAKAAGITIHTGWFRRWDSLENDDDALMLAVKLGMVIGAYAHYSTADNLTPNERIETATVWHSSVGGDPYAATRRAITIAAAEIGKTMT